jgi:hypothetical protein
MFGGNIDSLIVVVVELLIVRRVRECHFACLCLDLASKRRGLEMGRRVGDTVTRGQRRG